MGNNFTSDKGQKKKSKAAEVEAFLARTRQNQSGKDKGYREQSLKIHPWVCARCAREFTNRNVHELTVHHKDHDHENNPPDGSNWENLCIYCHDNEHRRHLDYLEGADASVGDEKSEAFTHNPFDKLKGLLKK
jgi:HNH endonuclease